MSRFDFQRHWGPVPNYTRAINFTSIDDFYVLSGPCSVESEQQINDIAPMVKAAGATHLRGGVFRAGTYPGKNFGYVDQSLIKAFHRAANKNGLQNVVEILDYTPESLRLVLPYADCVQVGARSMQNYTLLKTLGSLGKTVFIKRSVGSTLDELMGSAEYVLSSGGYPVLIERGSSTHMNHVRWDLSISTIAAIRKMCDVPVIVDASHGTGRRDLVEPMTLAGVAAGANGLLCEVHEDPANSLSDPDQAITPEDFSSMMTKVKRIRSIL